MPLVITPEVGIPLPIDTTPEEIDAFREKARGMLAALEELDPQALEVPPTAEEKAAAHAALLAETTTPPANSAPLTPPAVKHLNALLNELDFEVLDVARRLKNYVTNKLILETNDADARIRLKALEMLGKVSDVGLFAERVDVNVTHRTVEAIEVELKKTLELYGGSVQVVEARDFGVGNVDELDLDAELGEKIPENAEKLQNTTQNA